MQVVQPVLKKQGLDTNDLSNFRRIFKLPFLSKLLEKVVFLAKSILTSWTCFSPAFVLTESVFLKFFKWYSDSGSYVLLVLLDLPAAFDTVDRVILSLRL